MNSPSERVLSHFPDESGAETRKLGILLSDVEPETVVWLWPGRIPLGKLTILDGDPGLGKSTVGIDIAARMTRGWEMPDGPPIIRAPAGVVILSAEDGLADTIRPRIDAAGGDPTRILALTVVPAGDGEPRPIEIPGDLQFLKEAIESVDAKLVIIDPLMAFLQADTDTHKDQSARAVLFKLAALAEEADVAVLLIRHLNKTVGGNPLYRGGGSIAFVAAARSALLVAKDPDNPDDRVLAPLKNNLAKDLGSLSFRLETAENGASRVSWIGASDLDAASLLSDTRDREGVSERDFAKEVVADFMSDGPKQFEDICASTKREGLRKSMTRKALHDLGCRARNDGFQGKWFWELPDSPDFGDPDDH